MNNRWSVDYLMRPFWRKSPDHFNRNKMQYRYFVGGPCLQCLSAANVWICDISSWALDRMTLPHLDIAGTCPQLLIQWSWLALLFSVTYILREFSGSSCLIPCYSLHAQGKGIPNLNSETWSVVEPQKVSIGQVWYGAERQWFIVYHQPLKWWIFNFPRSKDTSDSV